LVNEEVGDGEVSVESGEGATVAGHGVLGRSRTDPLGTAGQAFTRKR
jgi:hypothetical protein